MKNDPGKKVTPIMLGMTLSLLLLLLIAGNGFAATPCSTCLDAASQRAQAACPNDPPPWGMMGCYYWQFMEEKKVCEAICANETGGGDTNCSSAACRILKVSMNSCGSKFPNGGTICTNDCLSKSCANKTGTCGDITNKYKGVISLCKTECGCNPN
jgi:hypothetical protein